MVADSSLPKRNLAKRFACVVVGVASVLALVVLATAEMREVRVAWVPDGDTLILEDREVVRLKGIDAPEIGEGGEPDQYFAREATQRLEELVRDRTLTLRTGQVEEDRYGRTLAKAYLPSGESINLILVREGLAFYYPHPDHGEGFSQELLRAQKRAMDDGRGFWPEILQLKPEVQAWIGNKNSKRFHHPGCGYGQKIAPGNREEFSSLRDMFYEGYAPCRRCTPWPPAENEQGAE